MEVGTDQPHPLKHIDPTGTILLPGLLLLLGSPFLFGYAKPVPVNVRALIRQRAGVGSRGWPCHEHRGCHFGR
jgi:Zn-dependent protease